MLFRSNLTSLDFDTIRAQLTQFLSGQATLQDYNFAGSNIGVILDILAYNSYLNAFNANMVLNESFLDSAQLYSSVASHAKMLNYTPRSYRSSSASISINIPLSGSVSNLLNFTIPAGTMFTGQNSNSTYSFITDTATVLYPINGAFTANLTVFEGSTFTDTFIVDYSQQRQMFVMSSKIGRAHV